MRQLLVTLLAVLLSALPLASQTDTSSLEGRVTDPQGGAVAGAQIQLTNQATGAVRKVLSGASGNYIFTLIPPGRYDVEAGAAGFRTSRDTGLQIDVAAPARLDIVFEVGAVTERVEVTSAVSLLNTETAAQGTIIGEEKIQSLPLNGRQFIDLALLSPNVTIGGSSVQQNKVRLNQDGGFSASGNRTNNNGYMLDGISNLDLDYMSLSLTPILDTLAEFQVQTGQQTAEYGHAGGAQINVVTKSGTNRVHGSLFEYLRNDAFNANDFFDNLNGQPRPVLKRSQFGGTVGGPIVKDRIFFFFGYQGQRQSALLNGTEVTTYTPAELTGDFSQAVDGGPDPNVAAFLASHPYFVPAGGNPANAIIDPTKIDPVAQAFITAGLIPTSPNGQLFPRGSSTDNVNEYTGKADFYATQNDRIAVTVGSSTEPTLNPFSTGGGDPSVPGFPDSTTTTNQFLNVGYTKTISAALLNEFHATAVRYFNQSTAASHPPNPAALGIQINSDLPYAPPIINLFDSGLNLGFNENVPRKKADNTYAVSDSIAWTKGRHTVKAGGKFAFLQENSVYSYATNGWFFFYGAGTSVGSGTDLADFLFGAPDEYQQYPT